MSRKNDTVSYDLSFVIGFASIHLVNLTTTTSKWVKLLGTFLRGPTKSIPHTAKGQVMGMVCRSYADM